MNPQNESTATHAEGLDLPSESPVVEANFDDNVSTPNSQASTIEYSQTPHRSHGASQQPTQSGGSTTSYESEYEIDPNYTGPPPQSQPCSKHGVMYVPRGMRRVLVKKRKLQLELDDSPN